LRTFALGGALLMLVAIQFGAAAMAQAPAAATTVGREIGTVKAIAGDSLTLATDAGQQVTVSVPSGARILQLAPGSTSLKDAQTIALTGVSVGDRVLVTGKAGDTAGTFIALRVILMKSSAIAEKHAAEEADWQKRGVGGIVSAVDPSSETLTVTMGAKKIQVNTSSSTRFRRYAGDSVKFEDAVPGTLAQMQPGDQLRVLGTKSEDGSSMQAEEVVSGSFKNLAGLIASVNAASGTLTLKDLATKRMMTVKITANSNVHTLPPEAARMFAVRARGGAAGGAQGRGAGRPEGARGEGGMGARGSGAGTESGAGARAGSMRSAGSDLSQLVNRLPPETIADLKVGDAVMVVASQAEPGSAQVTAVTLLAGVEPILAAAPSGTEMTLSPWLSGAPGDAGGSDAQQ
jgi:hypothetical protein